MPPRASDAPMNRRKSRRLGSSSTSTAGSGNSRPGSSPRRSDPRAALPGFSRNRGRSRGSAARRSVQQTRQCMSLVSGCSIIGGTPSSWSSDRPRFYDSSRVHALSQAVLASRGPDPCGRRLSCRGDGAPGADDTRGTIPWSSALPSTPGASCRRGRGTTRSPPLSERGSRG